MKKLGASWGFLGGKGLFGKNLVRFDRNIGHTRRVRRCVRAADTLPNLRASFGRIREKAKGKGGFWRLPGGFLAEQI